MNSSDFKSNGSVSGAVLPPSNINVRITRQDLTSSFESASADVALEPPDSGDFHEVFAIPDGTGDIAVLMGDVTGHGAPAAVKARAIRGEAIAQLKSGHSPLETIQAANASSQSSDDRFATVFVAKIDGNTGVIQYANAGHEPPIVAKVDGASEVLETTGPPLGVLPADSNVYDEKTAELPIDGTLVVTTDGVSEARKPESSSPRFFGYERFRAIVDRLRNFSPTQIVRGILNQVLRFTKSVLTDDIIVLAVRRRLSAAADRSSRLSPPK